MKEYTLSTPFSKHSIYDPISTEKSIKTISDFKKKAEAVEKKMVNSLDKMSTDKKKKAANELKEMAKQKGMGTTIKAASKKAAQAGTVGGLTAIGLLPIALGVAKKFSNDNESTRKEAIDQIEKEIIIADAKMEKYKAEGKIELYAKWKITRKKLLQARGSMGF